jgi:two-component system response regulator
MRDDVESDFEPMQVLRPVILLLENDASDAFFFRRALGRLGYRGSVRTVTGMSAARSYLQNDEPYSDREYFARPDLIVCDMKLIASTGNEFLDWIRRQDEFRGIPIVMLSGSSLPEERTRAMSLGARAFYLKTVDINEMEERVNDLLKTMPPVRNGEKGR